MCIRDRDPAAQDVAERDDLLVRVGDLDADGGLAGNRTEDAHIGGGHRIRDVLGPVSYTHLRAHETVLDLVCRLLLEKKNN